MDNYLTLASQFCVLNILKYRVISVQINVNKGVRKKYKTNQRK